MRVYFTDSFSSWQKGAVENTNKLIRQYIPKGTDISSLTDGFIMKVQKKINTRSGENSNSQHLKRSFSNFLSNSGKLSLVPYTKDFGRITHF